MNRKKQSAAALEGNTAAKTDERIISFCTRLAVKLATYLRGLA